MSASRRGRGAPALAAVLVVAAALAGGEHGASARQAKVRYSTRYCRRHPRRCATPTPVPTATPPPTGTPVPTPSPGLPAIGGCQVFPADNPWDRDVSADPVDPNSDAYIASINSTTNTHLHADFGSNTSYGIPYVVVPSSQPGVPVSFTYADESDPGPYPVPSNAPVEAGSDHHVLVTQQGKCRLYEMFDARYYSGPPARWDAGSGAVFDLSSDTLRPDYWTSADAAGLPILPGLVRYDEVQSGAINHALRFTVSRTQRAFVHPATHYASTSTDPTLPPMGMRLRMKASFDTSSYYGEARVALDALKRYGMFEADNGSSWYVSGATDSRWNDTDLNQLKTVPGTAFGVVQSGPLIK